MAGPLLETKLHVPRRRRGLVARPRLIERLRLQPEPELILVSAPAGFGKTTLLAEWLAAVSADGRRVAWLSLDKSDNDPALFWTYLIGALRTAADGAGGDALTLLQSPQPPMEAVLATLLNELSALPDDVVLVLDDYHVIDAREVQDGMAFLLDHLPPQLHLVIASRADPAAPLARLRARGELVEARAADLRFTPDEAAAYLNGMMGSVLTAQDVARLEGRTEGWIAALQLAALSIQGRDDVAAFIADFAGDDRYIVDYLAEEVLQRQPEPVQRFLLQTSVLDRLSGPLCDAVTGQDDGKAMLAALERGNLFLVPLDDRRRWSRYHQLFADVLRAHLLDEQPDHVPDLNRRANAWYERNGQPSEAIRHALAAGDVGPAAELVEQAIPAFRRRRQEATIRGWLDAIPSDVVRVRPVLAVGFIGVLMASGEFEGVEDRLRDAERWLEPTGDGADATRAPPAGLAALAHQEVCPPRRGIGPLGARPLGRRRPRGRPPGLLGRRRGAAAGRVHRRRPGLFDHPGGHPDHPGSPGPGAAHLRAGAATGRRPAGRCAAGNGGHARGDEPDRPRAQRPARRHPAPAARPGAGRAHLAAAEPLSLAGREGAGPGSRGRPGRRPRPARGGAARVHGRLLPERAADPGVAGPRAGRPGSCGRSLRLGARAGPVG